MWSCSGQVEKAAENFQSQRKLCFGDFLKKARGQWENDEIDTFYLPVEGSAISSLYSLGESKTDVPSPACSSWVGMEFLIDVV